MAERLRDLDERVANLERAASLKPAFSVAQYNILASYLGNNTEPWFMYDGLGTTDEDRQRADQVARKHRERDPDTGEYINKGWPNYATGLLTEEEIARVEATDRSVFAWGNRRNRILDEIRDLDADVVSLVELDQYDEFFSDAFEQMGYGSVWRKRPRSSSLDGCCILYRRSKFQLLGEHGFDYSDTLDGKRKDRTALMLLLGLVRPRWKSMEEASEKPERIIVCSTHLARNPEDVKQEALRIRQAAQLFRELHRFADECDAIGAPAICAGDWNAQSMAEIKAICVAVFALLAHGVSSHPLLWSNADVPTDNTSFTTARQMRIDYLLFQTSMLDLQKVRPLPPLTEPIPNAVHPSDHLPIMAHFVLKSDIEMAREMACMWLSCLSGKVAVLSRPLRTDELDRAFSFFDTNRDGKISHEEMVSAMQRLPFPGADPVSVDVMERVSQLCTNETGCVSKESFCAAFEEHFNAERMKISEDVKLELNDEIKRAFEFFDRGGGSISLHDLSETLHEVSPIPLETGEVMAMLKEMDTDGDGQVSFAEFVDAIMKVKE